MKKELRKTIRYHAERIIDLIEMEFDVEEVHISGIKDEKG